MTADARQFPLDCAASYLVPLGNVRLRFVRVISVPQMVAKAVNRQVRMPARLYQRRQFAQPIQHGDLKAGVQFDLGARMQQFLAR